MAIRAKPSSSPWFRMCGIKSSSYPLVQLEHALRLGRDNDVA